MKHEDTRLKSAIDDGDPHAAGDLLLLTHEKLHRPTTHEMGVAPWFWVFLVALATVLFGGSRLQAQMAPALPLFMMI